MEITAGIVLREKTIPAVIGKTDLTVINYWDSPKTDEKSLQGISAGIEKTNPRQWRVRHV